MHLPDDLVTLTSDLLTVQVAGTWFKISTKFEDDMTISLSVIVLFVPKFLKPSDNDQVKFLL